MAINKFEQLRQAAGGFKKSDTLSRFKQEIEYGDSRKKSQLVALKILRTLRKRGLSQKHFAEQLNVTPQQVSKWVKGSENFTFETIEKIEKALGITLIDIPVEKAAMVSVKFAMASASYFVPRTTRSRVPNYDRKVARTRVYPGTRQYA